MDWKYSQQRNRREIRHVGCRWNTQTIQSRIFAAMRIICQIVRKNCILSLLEYFEPEDEVF